MTVPTFTARKTHKEGTVQIAAVLKPYDYGMNVKVDFSVTISTEDARAFAAELIAQCDASDAKLAARKAKEERRAKWKERKIAAGAW